MFDKVQHISVRVFDSKNGTDDADSNFIGEGSFPLAFLMRSTDQNISVLLKDEVEK